MPDMKRTRRRSVVEYVSLRSTTTISSRELIGMIPKENGVLPTHFRSKSLRVPHDAVLVARRPARQERESRCEARRFSPLHRAHGAPWHPDLCLIERPTVADLRSWQA